MIIYIVLMEFWIWGNSFFPGCDQLLSSPYIISIFEDIVKHAGDWNKEAISQKARNAALNPPSLHAWTVSDRLEGRSFSQISVRKGQFDFHTTWYITSRSRPYVTLFLSHAKADLKSICNKILIAQSVFQRYLKLV